MKILITGATGFIGQALSERLQNHQIHALKSDLRDHSDVAVELIAANPDIIIHLAARTEVEKSFYEQAEFSDVNYTGTVNLIECAKNLPDLKLFVFSSTMETYGWSVESESIAAGNTPDNLKPFTEETIQYPNAPYAVAKLGCEKYLEYAGRAYNFPFTILRQTNTYGRKDNDFFVVEQIITQALKSNVVNLGYRTPLRNFLYIDDLIDVYALIVNNPAPAIKQTFCLGPANALSIEQLAEKILTKLNWQGQINWDTKPHRPGEIYYLNSTAEKLKQVYDWQPKTDLDTGLDLTIAHWKSICK